VSQDLSHTIDVSQTDEIGRLAGSFNTMLRALDESKRQQQQLVMDASHELRTPLTSLRTNIEVLTRGDDLPVDDKRHLLDDVNSELEELTTLVGELVELATEPSSAEAERVDVRLDEVLERIADRARRRSGLEFVLDVEPTIVVGSPALLERAAGNLVDNAIKWSPAGGRIEVTLCDGVTTVVDQGPGIPPEDQPHVFDRFYRSAAARSKPGSGLGLSIVRKIVESHGGRAFVQDGPDGGTAAGFSLPHERPDAG
jgi:two-component system sensor histidine kinase MprB